MVGKLAIPRLSLSLSLYPSIYLSLSPIAHCHGLNARRGKTYFLFAFLSPTLLPLLPVLLLFLTLLFIDPFLGSNYELFIRFTERVRRRYRSQRENEAKRRRG